MAKQFFRGDEANLAEPLPSYAVFDGRLDFRVAERAAITVEIRNISDANYATLGVFGEAEDVLGDSFEGSHRFITPVPPRSFSVALKTRF